jgi:hypothetical protein
MQVRGVALDRLPRSRQPSLYWLKALSATLQLLRIQAHGLASVLGDSVHSAFPSSYGSQDMG